MAEKEANTEIPKTGVIIPLDVRCGHCYHFDKQRAERYPDICSRLGILKIGRPCVAFMANVNTLSLKNEENHSFAAILEKIPTTRLAAYAALINQERTTRRRGYKLGQVVYVKLLPDDYLSNYAKAWVLLAKKNTVIVQGQKGFRGSFLQTSVLTEAQFTKKRQALIARKRINDPNYKKYMTALAIKIEPKELKDYVPPTIDDLNVVRPPKKAPIKQDLSAIIIR